MFIVYINVHILTTWRNKFRAVLYIKHQSESIYHHTKVKPWQTNGENVFSKHEVTPSKSTKLTSVSVMNYYLNF